MCSPRGLTVALRPYPAPCQLPSMAWRWRAPSEQASKQASKRVGNRRLCRGAHLPPTTPPLGGPLNSGCSVARGWGSACPPAAEQAAAREPLLSTGRQTDRQIDAQRPGKANQRRVQEPSLCSCSAFVGRATPHPITGVSALRISGTAPLRWPTTHPSQDGLSARWLS